jgi:hypothetical protein
MSYNFAQAFSTRAQLCGEQARRIALLDVPFHYLIIELLQMLLALIITDMTRTDLPHGCFSSTKDWLPSAMHSSLLSRSYCSGVIWRFMSCCCLCRWDPRSSKRCSHLRADSLTLDRINPLDFSVISRSSACLTHRLSGNLPRDAYIHGNFFHSVSSKRNVLSIGHRQRFDCVSMITILAMCGSMRGNLFACALLDRLSAA